MTKGKKISEIAKEQEAKTQKEVTQIVPDIEGLEKAQVRLDFKTLSAMPSKYGLALWKIEQRLVQLLGKVEAKGVKNFIEKTMDDIETFAIKLNEDFIPTPPKHIEDAFAYAKNRSVSGTYIAVLDANKQLVKLLVVERNAVWKDMPSVAIEERTVTIEMNAKFVTIAGTEFGKTESNPKGGRAVAKRSMVVVPFSTDLEKIYEYKDGVIAR